MFVMQGPPFPVASDLMSVYENSIQWSYHFVHDDPPKSGCKQPHDAKLEDEVYIKDNRQGQLQ